jgi:hypothetical protein
MGSGWIRYASQCDFHDRTGCDCPHKANSNLWKKENCPVPGHQKFRALSSEEVAQAAAHVADMQKWAREAYLSTKHVEDIESIWLKYFEAEHELHWILPPSSESGDS